mgnify:CR=1 FL=1
MTIHTKSITQETEALSNESLDNCLNRQMIAIIDFGSQYSELIARRIRETQVYSEVLSYRTTAEQLKNLNPRGIILSGGPSMRSRNLELRDPHSGSLLRNATDG